MGLYDDVLAAQRQKEAMAAIDVPAAQATQYGAALGMSRAKQGVNQMFGIEEPAVIQAKAAEAKQAQLNSIVSKYSTASTREDFTAAFSELMANGFPEHAAKMQEHLKNMPKDFDTTADIKNFNQAVEKGFTGSFFEYQRALKSGDTQVTIGNIPQDFIVVTNDLGQITMEVIPGSPTDIAAKKEEAGKKDGQQVRTVQKSIVVEDIDRLKTKITEAPWYNPVAGSIIGKFMENPYIGSGGNRIDGEALATTIKSSIGFDRLQQMRDESPTGGALGQVSELELITLQATLGSLDLNQSEEQLLANLDRLGVVYAAMLQKIAETGDGTFEEKMMGSASTTAAGIGTTNFDPLGIR